MSTKVAKLIDKQIPPANELAPLADELGQIKADLSKLEKRKKAIGEILKDAGIHELEGDLFRVVASQIEDAHGTDWEKIAINLGATERMVNHEANRRVTKKAHTRLSVYGLTS